MKRVPVQKTAPGPRQAIPIFIDHSGMGYPPVWEFTDAERQHLLDALQEQGFRLREEYDFYCKHGIDTANVETDLCRNLALTQRLSAAPALADLSGVALLAVVAVPERAPGGTR